MDRARITDADARWLAWHEAQAHGLVGREVRELGDAVLLHDATDREPFWNRIAGIDWPVAADAFDRRLSEALVLFATLDRIPHVWPLPGHDQPRDLVRRLEAAGFEDLGRGLMMVLDPSAAPPPRALPPGVQLERLHRLGGPRADAAADTIAAVLVEAFTVEPERRWSIAGEHALAFGQEPFHVVLARVDGEPAAVARRTTFSGASYLSSIGTFPAFRGRGLGRIVTEAATADALAAGSRWTYLGVYEDNAVARGMYERLGFRVVGGPAPDLLLRS